MSKFYMAGAFPGCSQLWTKAVPCDAEEILHHHVLDGGHRLNHNLDLEEHQQEVPILCKSSLARLVLATSWKGKLHISTEVHSWGCKQKIIFIIDILLIIFYNKIRRILLICKANPPTTTKNLIIIIIYPNYDFL